MRRPTATPGGAVQGDWPAFVNTFIEASFRANPGFAVSQGRHEYDGQIADFRLPRLAAKSTA